MPSWDIAPSGVRGVLGRTQSVASSFEGQFSSVATALTGGAQESSSPIVASAVGEVAGVLQTEMRAVVGRTGAAMSGCAEAVTAYVQGDLVMAAAAQDAAAQVPVLDIPGRGGPR